MCNGGNLDEGSRIFYPSIERDGKKFAKDVKHVAFIEYSDIGIVTAANYSQRRGDFTSYFFQKILILIS